MIYLSKAL